MGLIDPPGFRRNRRGDIWLHLPETERHLIGELLDQMAGLLEPPDQPTAEDPLVELVGIDPAAVRPADPALARLFPDAYTDAEQADEFRRFTMRDLRTSKLAHVTTARQTLERPDPTKLDEAERTAWLLALNDLRLTLGTRLAVTEESSDQFLELPDEDPQRTLYLVYDWLTHLQDRLIHSLDKGLPG